MNIVANIPGAIKALGALKYLKEYRHGIHEGRETGDKEKERANILNATSAWGKNMLDIFGATLEVENRENLPTEGPVVYVANHQGYADIIALCAALDTIQFGFVAKKELAKVPAYGEWILEIRSVLIERDNPRESLKAISKGIALIEDGFSLLIFPEGTRAKCSEMGEFKKGALKLATKPAVPIVPISIDGTYDCFESTGKMQGAPIKIRIHPPIETASLSKEEESGLSDKVHNIIETGVRELSGK